REWGASPLRDVSYCAYERIPTHGVMVVGASDYANTICAHTVGLSKDHIEVGQPADSSDEAYVSFKQAFKATTTARNIGSQQPTSLVTLRKYVSVDCAHTTSGTIVFKPPRTSQHILDVVVSMPTR